jgi:hypothetical protein
VRFRVFVISPTVQVFLHGLLHREKGSWEANLFEIIELKDRHCKIRKRPNNLMAKGFVDFQRDACSSIM